MALVSDTLANLRTQLSKRLGFGSQANTAGPFQDLLTAALIDAHEQLVIQYVWPEERRDWIFALLAGQTLYKLPVSTDARTPDPERIIAVSVQVNSIWSPPLHRGVDPALYTIITNGIPTRYDIAHGNGAALPDGIGPTDPVLEVWQAPATTYNLRIRAYAMPRAFAADADTSTVDSRLLFLMTLANMKAHYGQPDASSIANQLQLRLRKLRARNHNGQTYRRQDDWTPSPQPVISNPDDFN